MKKLILIFTIILFSCNPKGNEIENIEIMSYYYVSNENQNKRVIDNLDYSIIDGEGNTKSIKKVDSETKKYAFISSTIDKGLLQEISKKNRNIDAKFYQQKIDTFSGRLYCGPIVSVRIKYTDKELVIFSYSDDRIDSKYSDFIKLQNSFVSNYSEKKYKPIDNTDELKIKQKEFETFSINRDELSSSIPKMRKKLNEIKFVK
ncbi:TPA: hypothetical protein ACGFUW_001169 [Flavobacterium psychrophilum]